MSLPLEDLYWYRVSHWRNLARYRAYYRFSHVIIDSPLPLQTLSPMTNSPLHVMLHYERKVVRKEFYYNIVFICDHYHHHLLILSL